MNLEQTITSHHNQPLRNGWRLLLIPAAFYGWVGTCRRWLYEHRLLARTCVTVPVVSVGNLTAGGTGKTPLVIALARWYSMHGARVIVLSRGYRAQWPAQPGEQLLPEHGDEPYCIQQAVPGVHVWVGSNRSRLAKLAVAHLQPDIILLDDGYQHLRLNRDVDIVLIDGVRGLGNGRVLPAGPLREPIPAPKRSGAPPVVYCLTKQPEGGDFNELTTAWPDALRLVYQITYEDPFAKTLADKTVFPTGQVVYLITGIANPTPLLMALQQQGIQIQTHVAFPDHHAYRKEDLYPLIRQMPPGSWLVTTRKDWVKWSPDWVSNITVRVADLVVTLPQALLRQLPAPPGLQQR